MIFRRSLVRELTLTAIGLFLVLAAILFTNLVLRLIARAAGGTVAPEGIVALLGFNALFYLNILLTVALFLTVLLTLTRWYRDSEMIVWFTAGQSLTAWLKPILLFAAPFLAAILALSLFLSPWAERRKLEFEQQLESREEIALLAPGLFREFKRAKLVVFVESVNTFDGTIRNVFLQSTDPQRDETTVARIARLEEMPNGDRFIMLEDGRRYEGKPGSLDYRIIEFAKLGRRIEPAEARNLPASRKAIPTEALLATEAPLERSELFWRLSVPILALVLTVVAIPLGQVNPRMGRSFNLLSAAFLYMVYSNGLNIIQSLIAQGKLDFWVGFLVPHALAIALTVLLFAYRMGLVGAGRERASRPALQT
jgi:lipopolysaccharide export system permease protein